MKHAPESFTVGDEFHLAFSPERVDPGQDRLTIVNTPKVIGGMTPACTEVARALYSPVVEKVVTVSFHDPYFDHVEVEEVSLDRTDLTPKVLKDADCLVITAGHSAYDWQWIVDNTDLLLDTRNATVRVDKTDCEIHKL